MYLLWWISLGKINDMKFPRVKAKRVKARSWQCDMAAKQIYTI